MDKELCYFCKTCKKKDTCKKKEEFTEYVNSKKGLAVAIKCKYYEKE